MTWNRNRLAAVALTIALAAAACGGGDDDSAVAPSSTGTPEATDAAPTADVEVTCEGPLAEPVTVRMGDIQSASQAGQYLAMDLGYFADLNIEPELVPVQGAGAQIALFATDELDIATGTPSPGFFNAIAGDVGIKFIGTWVTQESGDATVALVVKKELFENGEFSELEDMAGHTIAQAGAPDDTFVMSAFLDEAGLGLDDITIETLAYPDMLAALASGAVDGALMLEPFTGIAEAQGAGVKLVPYGDVLQGPVTFTVASTALLDDDPQVGACFMEAFLKGQAAYADAFFGSGDGLDEAIDILTQRTRLTDPDDWTQLLERDGLPKVPTDGAMAPDALDRFQDYYVAAGTLQEYLPPEETVDLRFVPTSSE